MISRPFCFAAVFISIRKGKETSLVFITVANGFGYAPTTDFQCSLALRGVFLAIGAGETYSPAASTQPKRKSSEIAYRLSSVITFFLYAGATMRDATAPSNTACAIHVPTLRSTTPRNGTSL